MPQTALTQQAPSPTIPQESTCATCPKFKDFHEVNDRGWCNLFDSSARKHHQLTQDCLTAIESEQLKLLLDKYNAFLKPIALNFPGRNVFKQDPEGSYSKIGYVGQNMVGWFANDKHGFTVIEQQPSQLKALEILLKR